MPKQTVQETEDQQFKRITSKSIQTVLGSLHNLGRCSNKRTFSYSNDDVSKIFTTIESEVKRIKALFSTAAKADHV